VKILADENIPFAREAFGTLGEVVLAPGRAITREMLREADALVVRSVTRVDAALLEGTPVRFVGTCTIGEDHVDRGWLRRAGIAFSSAPGCNANSVGEYVAAVLLELAEKYNLVLDTLRLGIIGVGNAGGKVLEKATALGLSCVLHDPPLAAATGHPRYRPLEELRDCHIFSFHVPLEKSGAHPTHHLVNEDFLAKLWRRPILINTSRGAVVDNQALKAVLRRGRLRAAVLDVWENEPTPDPELLELVDIATPHIAGYSYDGKINGTVQVYQALCRFLGLAPEWTPEGLLPPPPHPELHLDPAAPGAMRSAVHTVYDIMADDRALRELLHLPPEQHARHFDQLRKHYPQRREFHNTTVRLSASAPVMARCMQEMGFVVEEPSP